MQISNYISLVVSIGEVPMGGGYPIRIQSMTTTNTLDTNATVGQAIRMIAAGCEYVRITAQGVKEAANLQIIKQELKKRGYEVPLIADIHYNPKAAEVAARFVEKVRINPGNYSDRKRGKLSYSESEYRIEIEKIRERIQPLIEICTSYGTAIRIGSNHGSLSERILFKYGDTPAGMVESALEFVRICRELNFHNLVLSMKASNVKVMVQANRLLVKRMMDERMNYPIHLGVTEAGDGEDGRIKSAAGIGPLLMEGIGDTVRVSLTEDPEFEIPVAKELISRFSNSEGRVTPAIKDISNKDTISHARRATLPVDKIGNGQVPVVILSADNKETDLSSFEKDSVPDYLFNLGSKKLQKLNITGNQFTKEATGIILKFIETSPIEKLLSEPPAKTIIVLKSNLKTPIQEITDKIHLLTQKGIRQPIILNINFEDLHQECVMIQSATICSYFLVDGLIDGIWISHKSMDLKSLGRIAYGILQATGARITKTEYIACPSCGRTLFNIQETLQRIKSRTSHLKGLKIGVMGCYVNGPGEMADADYGYVGAGKRKITLYKGKQIIQSGIPEQEAVEALVELIKKNGDWK